MSDEFGSRCRKSWRVLINHPYALWGMGKENHENVAVQILG
jgi:hypothetical protein